MKTPLLLLAVTLWSCDTLECGPGTHRERDLCVANARVVCAEGTALEDGRCVATGTPAADAAPAEMDVSPSDVLSSPADTGRDAALDAALDATPPPSDALAVDATRPPTLCPPERTPGTAPADCGALPPGEAYCVLGLALDLTTGCALPEGLPLLLIDPALAAAGQPIEAYTRGEAVVGPGGAFAVVGTGAAQQLALVFDDAEQLRALHAAFTTAHRSLSGTRVDFAADVHARDISAMLNGTSFMQQRLVNKKRNRGKGNQNDSEL
jgi:hypothetical protein